MKKSTVKEWPDLFFSGQFGEIVESHRKGPREVLPKNIPYVVGSMVFMGRGLEAELLYKNEEAQLSSQDATACVFYLVLSHTRKSDYTSAQQYLSKLEQLVAEVKSPEADFYFSQAQSFLMFFCGQYDEAKKVAIESLRFALKSKKVFFQVLARDLLGHARVKTGEFFSGLEFIKEAAELAESIGNTSWTLAAQSAVLLAEAEYGHRRDTILQDLNNLREDGRFQDSYSQITLALELARQNILRGQWKRADDLLNQIAPVVFKSENRRQEIILNLHWAQLWNFRGQKQMAMQCLRAAHFRLHSETDRSFELKLLLAEVDLFAQEDAEYLKFKERILELSQNYGEMVEKNQIARKGWSSSHLGYGEDALHNFITELRDDISLDYKLVKESGYHCFFYRSLKRPYGEEFLFVNTKTSEIVSFSGQAIQIHKMTKLSLAILELLSKGSVSKDRLVQAIWGYSYDPLRHDSLIYSAVSQLRRQLGERQHWVINDELSYHLAISLVYDERPKSRPVHKLQEDSAPVEVLVRLDSPQDLNRRQMQVIDYLVENQFIDTRTVKSLFAISEITASRDLSDLQKKGYVLRVGHGRATSYTLGKRRI